MFYTKEDVQPVVNAATELFGPPAQYQPTPFMYLALTTPKYGRIWYGDTSMDATSVRTACLELAKAIQEPIIVIDLGTNHPVFTINS